MPVSLTIKRSPPPSHRAVSGPQLRRSRGYVRDSELSPRVKGNSLSVFIKVSVHASTASRIAPRNRLSRPVAPGHWSRLGDLVRREQMQRESGRGLSYITRSFPRSCYRHFLSRQANATSAQTSCATVSLSLSPAPIRVCREIQRFITKVRERNAP